jgi:post-segregation antitoxin (ccd killing protein)
MRMARINVYLPDDLAEEAKAAGLNLSRLTQEALKTELSAERTSAWLAAIASLGSTRVSHDDVMDAVGEAKSDFEE